MLTGMSMTNLPQPQAKPEPDSDPKPPATPVRVQVPGVDAGFVPGPIELRVEPAFRPTPLDVAPPTPQATAFSPPVFGALAVIFGVTAFYKATLVLAPLGLLSGVVACFRRQMGWGLIGMLSALAALAVDPYFWGLAGLYWLARLLGLLG
jgi:hypothetical protein